MSTLSQSKIKTARKPARGDSYPCNECERPICPGEQYFSYQPGQRSSYAYCLQCARSRRDAYDKDGQAVDRPHHTYYVLKYGEITRPQTKTALEFGIVREGKLCKSTS